MDNQKADNQLNLAVTVPQAQRENSPELSIGYEEKTNSWEVIVKYVGNLNRVKEELEVEVTELLNEYAIIIISQEKLPLLSSYQEIQYIEKPKILSFEVINGISASCLSQLQRPPYNLTGKGVLIGVVDSGIDYAHPDFRNEDGSTRIVAIWDQTIPGKPPEGFTNGSLYTSEEINQALKEPTLSGREKIVPSMDLSGHGTHVAGIACGNGRGSGSSVRYRGVAFDADILIVKLGKSVSNSFPSTAQLMEGIDFCIRTALKRNQPLCINISFGNSYGSHSGQSLLDTYIDSAVRIGKSNIIVGTGNEGATGRHKSGRVGAQDEYVKITVGEREGSFNLSIWKYPFDLIDVSLIAPDGEKIGPVDRKTGSQSFNLGRCTLYLYYGEPSPYAIYNEIFIVWIPKIDYVETGEWTIQLTPVKVVVGDYFMWLPSGNLLSPATKFLRPTVEATLTIPSTSRSAIAVGAYNSNDDSFAPFSGRGYTIDNQVKPDIVAPGVGITSSAPGGGYSELTGTSIATPFVTGTCAMLQQWGIVDGNDPFMYGEKAKAILISTARKLPAFPTYPNQSIGYGALCLRRIQ